MCRMCYLAIIAESFFQIGFIGVFAVYDKETAVNGQILGMLVPITTYTEMWVDTIPLSKIHFGV